MLRKTNRLFLGLVALVMGTGLQANYFNRMTEEREETAQDSREEAIHLQYVSPESAAAARRLKAHAGYEDNHAQMNHKKSTGCKKSCDKTYTKKSYSKAKSCHGHAGHKNYEQSKYACGSCKLSQKKAKHPVKQHRPVSDENSVAISWAKAQDQGELAAYVREFMSSDSFKDLSTFEQRQVRTLNKNLHCGSLDRNEFNKVLSKSQKGVKLVYNGMMQ